MTSTLREQLLGTAEELVALGSWSLDLATHECEWSDGFYRLHGLAPQSVPSTTTLHLEFVHPDDRQAIETLIEQMMRDPDGYEGEVVDHEYRLIRRDGSLRELRGRSRVRDGRFFGVSQDVTEERLAERDLQAHYAVEQALREWESFEEGVVVLLRKMATALEFPTAAMWTWDPRDEELVCRAVWSDPSFDSAEWEAVVKSMRFAPGQGLPGRAWKVGHPVVSPDLVSDPNFRRPDVATATRLRSALLFPAVGYQGPIAVLAFYSFDRRDPSRRLIRTLTGLGNELGRFLERRRGQLEPSPLSARELEVLSLAAEGLSGPQIAERLIVSPSTVKTHFENIYEKLGVGDRAGAVAYALRIGLIT